MLSKKVKYILIVLTVIISISVGCASTLFWGYTVSSAVKHDAVIQIPTGSSYEQHLQILEKSGALKKIKRYKRYSKLQGFDKKAMPGRYDLKKGMTYLTLINMIGNGRQTPVNLIFNNIRTKERLAAVVAKYIEADSVHILNALSSDSLASKYGFSNESFIAMFIPNTYQLYWNTSAEQFIARMAKEYDVFWNESRSKKQQESGLTRAEIITIASIVSEETRMSEEMPRIAGLYLNRLRIGMPLQADPTVKFALGDFSIKRVMHAHLSVNSPYNTYKNRGLPPGPICIPSIKVIDAVLNAEKHDYLYFCVKDDLSGFHNFAKDIKEHGKNARAYWKALNARGIK